MNVSIVMACRNSNYSALENTIYSVLNQTYSDFEFIIIDDGSDIDLKPIFDQFNDSRIMFYKIKKSGLGAALNFGILKSKGKYIARIDDDDIMAKTRIEKQKEYLDSNIDVSCVGSQIYFRYENKIMKHRKFPENNDKIILDLIKLKFSLAHSSIMFKKEAFNKIGGYRIKGGGQDLDLFLQLSTQGKLSNLDEYLTYYNLSKNGLSVVDSNKEEAYLFALNSFNQLTIHKSWNLLILKTIRKLSKKQAHIKKKYIKRLLLIFYLRVLGKEYKVIC